MHPFLAVERLTEGERRKAMKGAFKLSLKDKEFAAVSVGAVGGGSIACTFAVVVPIMTNAVAAKKGEELWLENTPQEGDEAEGRVEGNTTWSRPIKPRRPERKRTRRPAAWKP